MANTFMSILTNGNRTAAAATANRLLADAYIETPGSINVLADHSQGGFTFSGKRAFIDGIKFSPVLNMTDLDIWPDCTKICWQWIVDYLGRDISLVKGFSKFIIDVQTGVLQENDLEFNSIAWGQDVGGT